MWKAGLKWIFLIVGTTVGAGYASGRELWQFFGYESGLAIILFGIFFIIACYVILKMSYERQSTDYVPILRLIVGKKLTPVFDIMIFFYLFTISVVMIAGSGVTGQAFEIPYWWGVAVIAIALILLFIRGVKGLVEINQVISPLLLGGLLCILILFMKQNNVPVVRSVFEQKNWYASFPFTALTIIPLLAVLGAIGSEIKSRGEIIVASVGSGVGLCSITYIYNANLIEIADQIFIFEMPLFAILQNYSPYILIFISILLWLAIFTTAASSIFGIATRIQATIKQPLVLIVVMLLILMIPLTTFGFSNLVNITYPIYGMLNLFVLTRLLFYPLWKNKEKGH